MKCDTAREQIQDWLDTHHATAMPEPLRDHVRECVECRTFIQSWNSIELRLQTAREDAPPLSSDFTIRLRARLNAPPAQPVRSFSFPRWQIALAASLSVILLLLMLWQGFRFLRAPDTATVPYASVTHTPPPAPSEGNRSLPAFSSQLPLADTTR